MIGREVMSALGMRHSFDVEWSMGVEEAREKVLSLSMYKKYGKNVKLFSKRGGSEKNFKTAKELTESLNLVLWNCGVRLRTQGERKGAKKKRENMRFEVAREEVERMAALINLRNPESRRTQRSAGVLR